MDTQQHSDLNGTSGERNLDPDIDVPQRHGEDHRECEICRKHMKTRLIEGLRVCCVCSSWEQWEAGQEYPVCKHCGEPIEEVENYSRVIGWWQRNDIFVHPSQIDGTAPNRRGIYCDSGCEYEAEPIL